MLRDKRQDRICRLAVRIADDAARADIEISCRSFTAEGREPRTAEEIRTAWYDTSTADTEDGRLIRMAVDYLELRGLIERHPEKRHWMRFVEG